MKCLVCGTVSTLKGLLGIDWFDCRCGAQWMKGRTGRGVRRWRKTEGIKMAWDEVPAGCMRVEGAL